MRETHEHRELHNLGVVAFEQGRRAADDPIDPARPAGRRPVSGNPGPVSLTRLLLQQDVSPSQAELAVVAEGYDIGVRLEACRR